MADFEVRVSGLQEVIRAMHDFNARMPEKVVKLALRQGANYMLKAIKQAAPVKTGRLRRAIRVQNSQINRINRNGNVGVYITVAPGKSRQDPRGAWYGKFVETGYNKGSKAVGGRQAVAMGIVSRRQFEQKRALVAARRRPGRTAASIRYRHGGTHVAGKHFVRDTFEETRAQAAEIIITATEVAGQRLAQQIGFTSTTS